MLSVKRVHFKIFFQWTKVTCDSDPQCLLNTLVVVDKMDRQVDKMIGVKWN